MPERIVLVGDIEIWSEGVGNPSGPALLLVMGANASALTWPDELVRRWAANGFHVIRYDHRDTGRSTHREFDEHPYALADLAKDAVAVLDGWYVAAAHVVGLSMGGTIGQLLALDYRERLVTLTLMLTAALDVDFVGNMQRAFTGEASSDDLPFPNPQVLAVLARRSTPVTSRVAELDRRVDEWRALSGSRLPFDAEEFRRWEEKAIEHAGTLVQPAAHARASQVPLERGLELRGVTTPTLVIQGSEDPLNPPPHGRHLASLIPTARLVEIDGLGHALPSCVHQRVAEEVIKHAGRQKGTL